MIGVDDGSCRLVGSTSNPGWYAEQLAFIPSTYRIVGGAELRAAASLIAVRMTAAAGQPRPPDWPAGSS